MKRYDERDVIFARVSRKPGTAPYQDYYQKNPERKELDDVLRQKPPLGDRTARFYHPHFSRMVDSSFALLSDLNKLCDGPEKASEKLEVEAPQITQRIYDFAQLYGAVVTKVAPYNPAYYYTHKGRFDSVYGRPIEDALPFTVVFAVEMNPELLMQSPDVLESIAVTKGYVDAGIVGLMLTYFIKSLGYSARNHMDGNYQMVLPLAAKYAGLGDIGRNGLITTPEFGSRVRLGAVSTDLPLEISEPSAFSITEFCNACKRCSAICPSKAIATDERASVTYDTKWSIDQEKCYAKWQEFGSDCGLCVAHCPFSAPLDPELLKEYIENPERAPEIVELHRSTRSAVRPTLSGKQWQRT